MGKTSLLLSFSPILLPYVENIFRLLFFMAEYGKNMAVNVCLLIDKQLIIKCLRNYHGKMARKKPLETIFPGTQIFLKTTNSGKKRKKPWKSKDFQGFGS